MWVKTIGRGWGGHSCKPNPYLSWLSNIKALKLVKAVAGLEKSDSGECIELTSMTPGNREYPKYDPPGAQISDDAIEKVSSIYSTLLAKT
jgi:hypothetical protein